jgi:hypothetical protein
VFSQRIKQFLADPLAVSVLWKPELASNPLVSYWMYPYDKTFKAPFQAQRVILMEAQRRAPASDVTMQCLLDSSESVGDSVSSPCNFRSVTVRDPGFALPMNTMSKITCTQYSDFYSRMLGLKSTLPAGLARRRGLISS